MTAIRKQTRNMETLKMHAFNTLTLALIVLGFLATPIHVHAQTEAQTDTQAETQADVQTEAEPEAGPGAAPLEARPESPDPNAPVELMLNFQDAPVRAVLEYLSETAGLAIVSEESLDTRITVISRQPVDADQALSLLNSVLKERDYAAVRTGNTLRIVTAAQARTMNIPVTSGSDPESLVPGDDIVTHIIPVRHLTAAALRENLRSLLPESAGIEANQDGNALIVTDTTANIRRLMEIIQAIDTQLASVAEIRVFRLRTADAAGVATLINSIFQQQSSTQSGRSRGRGGPGNPFEMMMEMRGRGRGGDEDGGQGATALNVQVVAAADQRTNSVVVRGSAEALRLVEDVILSLDDRTANVADVRVFRLRYADADNVAELINEIFAQGRTSSQNQSRENRFFRGPFGGDRGSDDAEQSGSAVQVVAAADERTNTVVVTGPPDILTVVANVVESLDAPSPDVADVKVFHLEYADADNAADLINEVFGQDRASSRQSSRQQSQISFRGGPFGGMAQQTDSGSSLNVAVVAAADDRTNSVVVSGPAETLLVVEQVIKQLDENPEQERQIFVYPCKNASADNLREILNNLFTEMQNLTEQTTGQAGGRFQGQTGGPGAQTAAGQSSSTTDLDEQAYFEADLDTNSVLVLTSSKNYQRIKPIIDELDKPIPQVLIKVLFAEISHSNTVDLGAEFSILNLRSDGDSTAFSTDFGISTLSDGLVVKAVEGDLNVTLRALQQIGRLNILSRPYILTANNQPATITVGAEVPFVTATRITETGQTLNTIEYQDIGIILEVTPSINPQGLVLMDVAPEISQTTGETVPIGQGVEAAVFAKRSSLARVAVQDGQTIVIGGLIEDTLTDNVRKVPLLGDIPLLGGLFRRTIKEKGKTELLIFLTPQVAPEPEALTAISERAASEVDFAHGDMGKEIFDQHMEAMHGPPDPIR